MTESINVCLHFGFTCCQHGNSANLTCVLLKIFILEKVSLSFEILSRCQKLSHSVETPYLNTLRAITYPYALPKTERYRLS